MKVGKFELKYCFKWCLSTIIQSDKVSVFPGINNANFFELLLLYQYCLCRECISSTVKRCQDVIKSHYQYKTTKNMIKEIRLRDMDKHNPQILNTNRNLKSGRTRVLWKGIPSCSTNSNNRVLTVIFSFFLMYLRTNVLTYCDVHHDVCVTIIHDDSYTWNRLYYNPLSNRIV